MQDGKQTREWKLWKHNDDVCYDKKENAIARALHPIWLIDNHIEWKLIHQAHIPGKLDVSFNARDALFYLVKPQSIEVLDEKGTLQKEITIRGGFPAVEYPNHQLYDTLTNKIVSYHLKRGITSYFSFDTEKWSNEERNKEEASNYNHARTFNPADSSFYFFGGYGFYQYRNDLFQMKSGNYKLEQVIYERPLYPRYSAAMTIVGDELYIFGGRGNKYGKQELSSHFYLGLCAINLKNNRSRIVWQKNMSPEDGTLMASSMYFEPSDSSFYAVSMNKGGILWKISMKDSVYTEVSKPIHNELNYQDCDFSLYTSPSHGKLFLVLDKIQNDHTHNVAIYSINMPLVNEEDIRQPENETFTSSRKYFYIAGILLLFIISGTIFYRSKYSKKKKSTPVTKTREEKLSVIESHIDRKQPEIPEYQVTQEKRQDFETTLTRTADYYDRNRASISLFGCFNVRDKEGNDITSNFTPRLKHLLILLILYTEKNPQGILASKATEILWPDKEETAARNNRNVNLRKLRVLLESIGDMEVVTENNFLRIKWGTSVFCDYHTLMTCTKQFEQEKSEELLNRILELLLYGPLLPNTVFDWLDDFKDAYSSHILDVGSHLLNIHILNISMCQLWIVRDSLKVATVNINERWDSLAVESLADNVQICPDCHSEQFCLIRTESEAADLLMSQKDEVGKHRHSHSRIISLDDCVGVELLIPAGTEKFKFKSGRLYNSSQFIYPDFPCHILHSGSQLYHIRISVIPYRCILRRCEYRQPCKVPLYADSLVFLNPALKIP